MARSPPMELFQEYFLKTLCWIVKPSYLVKFLSSSLGCHFILWREVNYLLWSYLQCSAVQCSALQCSAVSQCDNRSYKEPRAVLQFLVNLLVHHFYPSQTKYTFETWYVYLLHLCTHKNIISNPHQITTWLPFMSVLVHVTFWSSLNNWFLSTRMTNRPSRLFATSEAIKNVFGEFHLFHLF